MGNYTPETYQDAAGEWRWRVRERNGQIVAVSGEGYVNRSHAEAMVGKLFGHLEAQQQAGVPEGWVLVPEMATPKMLQRGWENCRGEYDPVGAYCDLLAAAPPPPAEADDAACTCSDIQRAHGHHFGCPELHAETAEARPVVDGEALVKLAGYFQDGSAETLRIFPDDATRTWHVSVGNRYLSYGKSIHEALIAALARIAPTTGKAGEP